MILFILGSSFGNLVIFFETYSVISPRQTKSMFIRTVSGSEVYPNLSVQPNNTHWYPAVCKNGTYVIDASLRHALTGNFIRFMWTVSVHSPKHEGGLAVYPDISA